MTNHDYRSAVDAVNAFREKHPNCKIGLTSGCFDLTHPGHVTMLEACRKQCDYLLVAITEDDLMRRTKSPFSSLRPVIPLDGRVQVVGGLRCVDGIVVRRKEDRSLKELVQCVKPDIRFFGPDQRLPLDRGDDPSEIVTIRIPKTHSSTAIIEKILAAKNRDAEYQSGKIWADDHEWYR